jgi:succinoglycan biosynthesis protein ExoA
MFINIKSAGCSGNYSLRWPAGGGILVSYVSRQYDQRAENPVNSRSPGDAAAKVSVVVPCRNERSYIDETIRSILAQQNLPGGFEVLVVDGGSDDGTRERLGEFQSTYPNLRVLDNEDRTTAYAMNLGVEAATGDFIAILGAHTTYSPDYLSTCLELLEEHADAGCVGGSIDSRGSSPFGRAVACAMAHPVGVGNARHRFPDFEGYGEGACFPVFRREVFDRVGLYDTDLVRNQDDEFNYRFRKSGGKIYLSPRAKSTYFVRESVGTLFLQYSLYGYYRYVVTRKHGSFISLRQLVPVLFFGFLLVSIPLTLVLPERLAMAVCLVPLVYLATLCMAAVLSLGRLGWAAALRLPVAMFTLHFSYALGFARAMFGGSPPESAGPKEKGPA